MKTRGFTLVELLVTIAIVATLAGISYPVIRSAVARSRQAACLAKLRGIGVALENHLQDHHQKMPVLASARTSKESEEPVLETVLAEYLQDPEAFHCPADREQFLKTGSSYFWNSTQNGKPATKLDFVGLDGRPQAVPLVADKGPWHPAPRATNILYGDFSASSDLRFATDPK